MNVRQGPETVFEQPPAEIFPALVDANATGENGRVGSEPIADTIAGLAGPTLSGIDGERAFALIEWFTRINVSLM